ncbi:hypothetical protein L1987_87551 [Smallanthus sonchifolius]|nr:hypothetical protein L1987_87551 [Smallanthus sonchifolius]
MTTRTRDLRNHSQSYSTALHPSPGRLILAPILTVLVEADDSPEHHTEGEPSITPDSVRKNREPRAQLDELGHAERLSDLRSRLTYDKGTLPQTINVGPQGQGVPISTPQSQGVPSRHIKAKVSLSAHLKAKESLRAHLKTKVSLPTHLKAKLSPLAHLNSQP